MPPHQNQFINETSSLRRIISGKFIIRQTSHSIDEMANDAINDPDIMSVLSNGRVTFVETKKDILWHIEWKESDSRKIRVVAAVFEDSKIIKIITVMLI